jgi:hypothetical protein
MSTRRIGNSTEAIVISEFVKREIPVSIPFGDAEPYDIVIEHKNELYKVQIKTSRKTEEGVYTFNSVSLGRNANGCFSHDYKGKIDYFATVIKGQVCLIDINEDGLKNQGRLRTKTPEKRTNKRTRCWKDYSIDNVLN